MEVCEIFKSIQGEGRLVGVVSALLRFWGCNLRCKWCDEKQCLLGKNIQNIEKTEIVSMIEKYNCDYIIITGGEPLLQNEISELCNILKTKGYHITIETNGTVLRENLKADLISISPKLSNSNPDFDKPLQLSLYNNKRLNLEIIKYYMENYDYQIKFVVEKEDDFREIDNIVSELKKSSAFDKKNILIMPLASSRNQLFRMQQQVVEWCVIYGYRYCNRLHLQIWGKGKERKIL